MYKNQNVGSEVRVGVSISDLILHDPLDRKWTKNTLDKLLQGSSSSTSKAGVNGSNYHITITPTSSSTTEDCYSCQKGRRLYALNSAKYWYESLVKL